MFKVLKFAKQYWYTMIIILALLFIQANCDLALPEYTSKIVDTGIQAKGIESVVPEKLTQESFSNLSLFMTEEEISQFENAYTLKDEVYELNTEYEEDLDLKELLLKKETTVMMLSMDSEEMQEMKEQMFSQMGLPADSDVFQAFSYMPKEAVLQISDAIEEKIASMSDMIGESTAIEFVAKEYETVGIDVHSMQMKYLFKQGAIMLGIALLGMIVAVIVTYLSAKLAAKVSMNLRNEVFNKVVKFSNAELNNFSTASLITRCTNDIQQVQMVLTMMFRIVLYAPLMGIGGILKVVETKSGMGWIIFVAVLAVLCIVAVLMVVAMPKFKSMQVLVDKLNLVSREILTGISVIRAFGREKHEEKRFDEASMNLKKTQVFTNRTMAFMMPMMMLIMNGITVLIIWVGAKGIDLGNLQVGTMMAFITYTMQIVMSFLMITMVSIMLPRAAVAATRIDEVLSTEIVIDNAKSPVYLGGNDNTSEDKSAQKSKVKGVVEFNHVSFVYPGGEENALEDIHFRANPGETTAFIGSTGCGKTSLVQLIPRLFDVTEGKITIDGIDVRDIELENLRDQIGYVPQKGVLFSGTIKSNIGFGSKEVNQESIERAANIAQATEFIEGKEDTYDSEIAQGGTNVSGGQKQRLAIARALAKNPQILIFDDSFSALDYKTDKALRKALQEQTKDATVLIVAQRISTILHADNIIVLDDGKIAGMGTHEKLLQNNEVYRQIASSQLSEKEIEDTLAKKVVSGKEEK